MTESAADTARVHLETVRTMLELSRILVEFVGVFRRHVANTTVMNDQQVTERNLARLDALEGRLLAILKEIEPS